MYILKYQKKSL